MLMHVVFFCSENGRCWNGMNYSIKLQLQTHPMEVTRSTIYFNYHKKRYEADVQLFKPMEKWQLWVRVKMGKERKNTNEMVFVFYKLKPGELFWYD
jgi:hypothetical protein